MPDEAQNRMRGNGTAGLVVVQRPEWYPERSSQERSPVLAVKSDTDIAYPGGQVAFERAPVRVVNRLFHGTCHHVEKESVADYLRVQSIGQSIINIRSAKYQGFATSRGHQQHALSPMLRKRFFPHPPKCMDARIRVTHVGRRPEFF
jgi:hypothetical protein